MKTPEDIKNGMKACLQMNGTSDDCIGCPYTFKKRCADVLMSDALDYIVRLEEQVKKLKKTLGWHDAEKDPPKKRGEYIIIDANRRVRSAVYDTSKIEGGWGIGYIDACKGKDYVFWSAINTPIAWIKGPDFLKRGEP